MKSVSQIGLRKVNNIESCDSINIDDQHEHKCLLVVQSWSRIITSLLHVVIVAELNVVRICFQKQDCLRIFFKAFEGKIFYCTQN